jgi:hypothetical protein
MIFNRYIKKKLHRVLIAALLSLFAFLTANSQEEVGKKVSDIEKEEDYYRLFSMPVPEHVILEVGGMATFPDGRLAVCTRRGEVWVISILT